MDTRNRLLTALATLLSCSLVTASAAGQDKQDPIGQVQDAAVKKPILGAPLTFSVEGLTKENLKKVTLSLTSMTEKVYACSRCKHEQATAGKCIPCDREHEAKKEPILSAALPSLKKESIGLTPFAARTLSYSALESALTKDSIEIDAAKFPLAGESRLVLSGGADKDIQAIEKALQAKGLFESAKASYDKESTEIHVVVQASDTPPVYDKVAAAIEALEIRTTLTDVIWGPQPVPAKD